MHMKYRLTNFVLKRSLIKNNINNFVLYIELFLTTLIYNEAQTRVLDF